ncbi:MAG: biotin--[acetyl-CoA-carboxylase] ligase [Turicibacter sp.]|nr:biotin--[acetyl-CoA-carboxylase] ligase [Turicibacter sp.]
MDKSKFEQQLKSELGAERTATTLHFFEETTSTNDLAKQQIRVKPVHGSAFIARRQSAGRGTYGRSFISETGGIYFSLLINVNDWHFKEPDLATIFTAVAVREAVADVLDVQLSLKWVNDLFLDGRKVGGILTEKQVDSDWLVIGIGLNVSNELATFPEALKDIVTTLKIADPHDQIKATLIIRIIRYLLKTSQLSSKEEVMQRYREYLFLLNQQVEISYGNELFQAHVLDVDDEGKLVVQKAGGEVLHLQAGSVKLVF